MKCSCYRRSLHCLPPLPDLVNAHLHRPQPPDSQITKRISTFRKISSQKEDCFTKYNFKFTRRGQVSTSENWKDIGSILLQNISLVWPRVHGKHSHEFSGTNIRQLIYRMDRSYKHAKAMFAFVSRCVGPHNLITSFIPVLHSIYLASQHGGITRPQPGTG